jgi:hypothetical protein
MYYFLELPKEAIHLYLDLSLSFQINYDIRAFIALVNLPKDDIIERQKNLYLDSSCSFKSIMTFVLYCPLQLEDDIIEKTSVLGKSAC